MNWRVAAAYNLWFQIGFFCCHVAVKSILLAAMYNVIDKQIKNITSAIMGEYYESLFQGTLAICPIINIMLSKLIQNLPQTLFPENLR